MANFNKVILCGNLTRDPQTKNLPSGSSVTEFGLAVNEKWKTKDGEQKESVCFVDCAAFGKTGETIEKYCQKGKPLLIEGKLKFDSWEDKAGGKRSKHSIVVESFQFLGGPREGGGEGDDRQEGRPAPQRRQAAPAGKPRYQAPQDVADDDIPF